MVLHFDQILLLKFRSFWVVQEFLQHLDLNQALNRVLLLVFDYLDGMNRPSLQIEAFDDLTEGSLPQILNYFVLSTLRRLNYLVLAQDVLSAVSEAYFYVGKVTFRLIRLGNGFFQLLLLRHTNVVDVVHPRLVCLDLLQYLVAGPFVLGDIAVVLRQVFGHFCQPVGDLASLGPFLDFISLLLSWILVEDRVLVVEDGFLPCSLSIEVYVLKYR